MVRTAYLSLIFACLAYASGQWLTHDFAIWTAEGARRLKVVRTPVPSPDVAIQGPGRVAAKLPELLAHNGNITIVDFFYTRCPSVCQTLGSTFQQLQTDIEAADSRSPSASRRVRLLSISFDPTHDGPAVLEAYASSLKASPQIWGFVTPTSAEALRALLIALEVVVIPDGLGGYEHNAALLVVDAKARLVRVFDYTDKESALVYAQHLATREIPD